MTARISSHKLLASGLVALAVCAAALLAILASGQSADAKASRSATLSAASNGALKFNKKTVVVSRGKVTLKLVNPSSAGITHAIGIDGHGVDKESRDAAAGSTVRVSARLKKGKYVFYCPIGAHREAGMKGTLIVK